MQRTTLLFFAETCLLHGMLLSLTEWKSELYTGWNLEGKSQAIVLACHSGGDTLAQIAQHFDVHYSTVSRAQGRREKPKACQGR
jgi:hypothetical protein